MQSGGTTIISSMWLRRPDTDGVLDTPDGEWPLSSAGPARDAFDIFHQKLCFSKGPITIHEVCLRLCREPGDSVHWYLIVRNPYHIIRSLKSKVYGAHWREKLAKYHRHYLEALDTGTPIVSYERFVRSPTEVMSELFRKLAVPTFEVCVESAIPPKSVYRPIPVNHTYVENPRRVVLSAPSGWLTAEERVYIEQTCGTLCAVEQYEA